MSNRSLRLWLVDWRPSQLAILVVTSVILFAGTTWIVQARSTAQIRHFQAEAASERAELKERFDALQGVLDRLGKTVASDQHPIMAADSGRRAIEAGRWGAGQLFLINAITNDPKNVEHLKTYTNAVLGKERPPKRRSTSSLRSCKSPPATSRPTMCRW